MVREELPTATCLIEGRPGPRLDHMPGEPYDECRSLAAVARMYELSGHDRAARAIADVLRVCQNEGSCPRTGPCRQHIDLSPRREADALHDTGNANGGTAVRLDRFATETVIADSRGNAIQRSRVAPADDETPLGTLFRYWRGIPGRPKLGDIDPMVIRRIRGLDGFVHVVQSQGLDPTEWRFRLFGHHLHLPGSPAMEGRRIFDGPPLIYAGAAARDYMTAKCMQLPMSFRVRRSVNGVERSFDRQVLPLFGGDGGVEYLLVAVGNFGKEGPG